VVLKLDTQHYILISSNRSETPPPEHEVQMSKLWMLVGDIMMNRAIRKKSDVTRRRGHV
jgi:hypothetical protein